MSKYTRLTEHPQRGRLCPPGCTCGRHQRPTYQQTCRRLRPGEAPPPGEPKRYTEGQRYVMLRWRVGPGQYIEAPEHRVVAGLPAADVHHGNGDKTDNAPRNLHPLSHADHARHHAAAARANSKAVTQWGGLRSQQAYDKQQRRLAREAARRQFLAEIVRLYESGLTVVEVGAAVGRDSSGVSRALRQAGVKTRRRR